MTFKKISFKIPDMFNNNERDKMEKCGECKSTNLEYYPDVDGQSWVEHIYVQKNGKWVIQVTGNLAGGKNDDTDDVSKIDTKDIYNNDLMAFFYCRDCTAELHGRDLA